MNIVCLDLEGVLVPEIWIAFSEASGIPELRRTTRDEPDYDKLMRWRLGILREHGLGLKDIQRTIATIDPMPGAKDFLDTLRSETQAIILSDTFTQFAAPLMEKLGRPTIFCNELEVGEDGMITGYRIRTAQSKLSTDHRGRGQLQRSGHDPGQQGRIPFPLHRADQEGPSGASGLRNLRGPAHPDPRRAVNPYRIRLSSPGGRAARGFHVFSAASLFFLQRDGMMSSSKTTNGGSDHERNVCYRRNAGW